MTANIQKRAWGRKLACMLLSSVLMVSMVPMTAFAISPEEQVTSSDPEETNAASVSDGIEHEGIADDESDSAEGIEASDEDKAEVPEDQLNVIVEENESAVLTSAVSNSDRLSVSLAYTGETVSSNGNITCGKPVQFTLNAAGGSGAYKYLLGSVSLFIDGELLSVHDGTWELDLSDSNTFEYTFSVPGTYYIYWTAYDAQNLENVAHVYQPLSVNDPSVPSIEALAQKVVDDCKAQGFSTQYEKALFYNDYIVDNTEYDIHKTNAGPIGVFVKNPDGTNGSATCEGYYQAFKMLLDRSGIQCVRTPGGGHVWATVCLDGVWTQVDPTWNDDAYAPLKNMYFGLTDEMSELVHHGYTRNQAYQCSSYERNYLYRSGIVKDVVDDVSPQIKGKLEAGERSFKIKLRNYYPYDEPYHCLYPMVTSELRKLPWESYEPVIVYNKDTSDVPQSLANSFLQVSLVCQHENVGAWQSNTSSHWLTCADCGGTVRKSGHVFGAWTQTSPSLFSDGRQSRSCNVCGYTATSSIKAKLPGYRNYAAVYDPTYYAKNNPDVMRAYHGDEVQIFYHFLNNGITEGRRGSASFDVVSYYNAYPDLRRAFGMDLRALTMHYVNYGKREGRAAVGVTDMRGFVSSWGGVNYAPIYDGKHYRDAYGDLKKAFTRRFPAGITLFDDAALLSHFINNGITEGRRGSASFDVVSYYNAYPDLRIAFGMNLRSFYSHYLNYGRKEGRRATGITSLQGFVTILNGVNYASVYNGKYYYDAYADLRKAFTRRVGTISLYDDHALLQHFVNYGMAEGRVASKGFNVHVYRSRYRDLQVAFGGNLKSYVMHYITFGQREERIAS